MSIDIGPPWLLKPSNGIFQPGNGMFGQSKSSCYDIRIGMSAFGSCFDHNQVNLSPAGVALSVRRRKVIIIVSTLSHAGVCLSCMGLGSSFPQYVCRTHVFLTPCFGTLRISCLSLCVPDRVERFESIRQQLIQKCR